MTATQILIILAELLGGLAFFMYGMSAMSSGLEQMSGGAMERTLKKVAKNDLVGFGMGAAITIAIQSSSAMTVMLVGLVNSGILGFADTFGMIMGTHVGTTLTSWILTLTGITGDNFLLTLLKPMIFAPLLAFLGIAMRMFSKRERKRNLGVIFIGFAVLMAGMNMMSGSMETFRQDPAFQKVLVAFTSPVTAFVVSTLFTGIIQSSAATVAIVQALAFSAFASENPVTYQIAIPLVIGANVGTCVTAILSSFGTSKDAKRVVALHLYTNAIGGVVCIALLYVAMALFPSYLMMPCSLIGVAVIHTLFNLLNTVAFIPFKQAVIRLCEITIRKDDKITHQVFLDERIFNNSPLAISECKRLTTEMAEYSKDALLMSLKLLDHFSDDIDNKIKEIEDLTDKYEDKLCTYLVRISSNELSESDSHAVSRLLHSVGDFERIADHALNLSKAAEEIKQKKVQFSSEAQKEIKVVKTALKEIVEMTFDSFKDDNLELASKVEPLEQVIDKLNSELKSRHVQRLQTGACTVKLGFVFSDLITNFERVSDHCSNIAVYTLQMYSDKLNAHKFLNKIKSSESGEFVDYYNLFSTKYSL